MFGTIISIIERPALDEILADPIIRAVMDRDGVTERQVFDAVAKAREGIANNVIAGRAPKHQHHSKTGSIEHPIRTRPVRGRNPTSVGRGPSPQPRVDE